MERNAPFAAFGRLLVAALFLISGIGKIAEPDAAQAAIAAAGIPLPLLSYAVAIAIEVGGSIFLIVGYRTQAVALILALFCVAVAFLFHRVHGDMNQHIHFLKDFAIAGGLLQLAAFGAGDVSLDAEASAPTHHAPFVPFVRSRLLARRGKKGFRVARIASSSTTELATSPLSCATTGL